MQQHGKIVNERSQTQKRTFCLEKERQHIVLSDCKHIISIVAENISGCLGMGNGNETGGREGLKTGRRVPRQLSGERVLFSTNGAGTTGFHMQKNKSRHLPHTIYKYELKMDHRPKSKS